MCIYQLLALTGDDFLYTLDVLDSHLVVRIGNARVAVLLFVEQRQLTLLVGQEDDLVIDYRLGVRDAVPANLVILVQLAKENIVMI